MEISLKSRVAAWFLEKARGYLSNGVEKIIDELFSKGKTMDQVHRLVDSGK
jgi:hypothetical protein